MPDQCFLNETLEERSDFGRTVWRRRDLRLKEEAANREEEKEKIEDGRLGLGQWFGSPAGLVAGPKTRPG